MTCDGRDSAAGSMTTGMKWHQHSVMMTPSLCHQSRDLPALSPTSIDLFALKSVVLPVERCPSPNHYHQPVPGIISHVWHDVQILRMFSTKVPVNYFYYIIIILFWRGQSLRCFKSSRNIKLAGMIINPVDPWIKPSCMRTTINRCTQTDIHWNKNLRDRHQNMLWCACQVCTRCREQSHWEDPAYQWLLGERCTMTDDYY